MKSISNITIVALLAAVILSQNIPLLAKGDGLPLGLIWPTLRPGNIAWQNKNFNSINGFREINKAVRAEHPDELKGARVTDVGIQQGFGTKYIIRYKKAKNTYEAEVWSQPRFINPRIVSFKQTSGDKPVVKPPVDPVVPVTPVTPVVPVIPSNPSLAIPGSTLNGAFNKGNYIWGGAMNLAWNELLDSFNAKQPLDLKVNNALGTQEAANFNARPFSANDLSSDSYYVKSGYGQSTVNQINREVKQKFPKKSFSDLKTQLTPKDLISYAYFIKQVQYLTPFSLQNNTFTFNPVAALGSPVKVQAFKATSPTQRSNIEVVNYNNDDDFVLKFKLKQENDELYVIKGSKDKKPQEIADVVSGVSQKGSMGREDKFAMPIVDLDVERKYSELIGSPVVSGKLRSYFIGDMFEKIKFRIDEVGAKVENEALMIMLRTMPLPPPNVRNFILDQPFWVVMKQKGARPYFMTQINTADFMKKI